MPQNFRIVAFLEHIFFSKKRIFWFWVYDRPQHGDLAAVFLRQKQHDSTSLDVSKLYNFFFVYRKSLSYRSHMCLILTYAGKFNLWKPYDKGGVSKKYWYRSLCMPLPYLYSIDKLSPLWERYIMENHILAQYYGVRHNVNGQLPPT